jgi:SAM-dependent methyltransferase
MKLYYRLTVPLFEWKEERWTARRFYHDTAFKALDKKLVSGPNPYQAAQVFPYGETPLRVLFAIAQAVDLAPTDHFVDLGCGRGRAVFFMSHFFGCRATGIDLTPSFIQRARKLVPNERVNFLCQDFLSYDFKEATCVYLYGTTYSEECLEKLGKKLVQLPTGSRVITVSEPLVGMNARLLLEGCFNWGTASIFLNEKR